ncbi:MAG: hypothetical protein AAF533_22320 [Acidobacteriota bacterium]
MTGLELVWVALLPVIESLEKLGVSHHVGGSVASSLLAIARSTQDVDLVADLETDHVSPFAESLEGAYYVDEQAVMDAVRRRASFNTLHVASMFKVDVFVSRRDRFSQLNAERRVSIEIPELNRSITTCSPEDIVLHKLDWFQQGDGISHRQWEDALNVLRFHGPALDRGYLRKWAELLERALGES